ncbi:MAG: DUF4124 domain-containing protein [Pseudomonadota bacterium]
MVYQSASRSRRPLAALALLLALPGLMGAEIYRWVDANGVVNFTQQKPRGIEAELVSSGPQRPAQTGDALVVDSSAEDAVPALGAADDGEPTFNPAQQRVLDDLQQAELDRQAALVEGRAVNCERARSVLTNLTRIGRVRVQDPDGTQAVMREEERQRRIRAAQEAIAQNCAG